ncbi:MAG: flagellar biosynthetic protein FliO [Oscillospiraceae bacterium]|nr:flagellar biosynthetic protein FliO [Oscillospiraceae bacterium]
MSLAPYLLNAGPVMDLWRLVLGIVLVSALLAGLVFSTRWLHRRGFMLGNRSEHIRIVDRVPLNREVALQIVQIGSKFLALGVGRDGVRLICELDRLEACCQADQEQQEQSAQPHSSPGFFGRFSHNVQVNMGLKPKGTPYMVPAGSVSPGTDGKPGSGVASVLNQEQKQENALSPKLNTPEVPVSLVLPESMGSVDITQKQPQQARDTVAPPSPVAPSVPGGPEAYRASVENITKMVEPDLLDRRSRGYSSGTDYPGATKTSGSSGSEKPESSPHRSALSRSTQGKSSDSSTSPDREERIDELLGMVANRQAHYTREKDADKP